MKNLLTICCIIFCFTSAIASVCYTTESYRTYRRCGFWNCCRCSQRKYRQKAICCPGWTGSTDYSCPIAICDGKTNPAACNRVEGNVKVSASGPVYNESGGTCNTPGQCTDCNPGYYADGPYCRACTEIENCHYPSCTTSANSTCQYCKGVVKDDPAQYGWWAFTRWIDAGLSCQTSCSWRNGSRCYPGSCSDTTLSSCKCEQGFNGTDCASITEQPIILGSFIQLKQITDTSVELVDAPPVSSDPSPQPTVYTNKVDWQTAEVYVDAQFVKTLPSTPQNFYVKHKNSIVGIVDGGILLTLKRGSSRSVTLMINCEKTAPVPNNFRCNGTMNMKDKWSSLYPLQNGDRILFSTFATNGGYVTIYDREYNDNEVRYDIKGKTLMYEFVVEIDTENPDHCRRSAYNCDIEPLVVSDIILINETAVQWQGWNDEASGIDAYHFEIFHLRSSGPGATSKLEQGEKDESAIVSNVSATSTKTPLVMTTPGPYSIIMTVYDKTGNHRAVRRLFLFDDKSFVETQGVRTAIDDNNGHCTWDLEPAAPIVSTASPNVNCNWIVGEGPVVIIWKDHFINKRHHSGQWLNPVSTKSDIDALLDDHEGQMSTSGTDNLLGVVKFQIKYDLSFEGEIMKVPWHDIPELHAQSTTLNEGLIDGMSFDITIRAFDITEAYADDRLNVKVDSSPPEIRNLWLTLGGYRNVSIHKMEDMSKLEFEWETYDLHSGIHSVQWRLFDNNTGEDFVYGSAYESPQGNTETIQQCEEDYRTYSGGAKCYCTPFDGCYHRHFQVSPLVDRNGTNGVAVDRRIGHHDSDYFIEVAVYNKAMLKTVSSIQITIDASAPLPGTVHEGTPEIPDVDFQQDELIHTHWKDFYDKESGIHFYDYRFGEKCFEEDDFDLDSDQQDDVHRTYENFASFTVSSEGKYFVTVVAYNHALKGSKPVCSDGITVDSTIPSVSHIFVEGAITVPMPLITEDDKIWYLRRDRTVQFVEQPSESCRLKALRLSQSELTFYKIASDSQGHSENLTNLDCNENNYSPGIISYVRTTNKLNTAWDIDDQIHLYNTEIGLGSSGSDVPNIIGFESVFQQKTKQLKGLNLADGQAFQILIRTTSKSGISNLQKIGPFIVDGSPPAFQGEISISITPEISVLKAFWPEDAFVENHINDELAFEYAIGTQPRTANVQGFRNLQFGGTCIERDLPICTLITLEELEWSLHHQHGYYVSIKATNIVGLSVTASSIEYTHFDHKFAVGVVLDLNDEEKVQMRQDADFTLSTTELKAEWFGFAAPWLTVNYTICQAKNNEVIKSTCVDVANNQYGTVEGLSMDRFQVYQVAVIARSMSNNKTVYSDGIMTINKDFNLELVSINDGPLCTHTEGILPAKQKHHNKPLYYDCEEDIDFQRSLDFINCHWTVPDIYSAFTPDAYVKIQQRAPVADYWEDLTEETHIMTSNNQTISKVQLQSGRKYRCVLTVCANKYCFPSLQTDGVTVTHFPPKSGSLIVEYENNESGTNLKITLDKFMDPDIEGTREALEAISHYEWSISDTNGQTLYQWTRVETFQELSSLKIYFEKQLDQEVTFTTCWQFIIRGYNYVGLYSTISKDIHDCKDGTTVKDPIVLDCVGPKLLLEDGSVVGGNITYTKGTFWTNEEKDYTPYDNIISAIWPTQRYPSYSYVLMEVTNMVPILHFKRDSILDISRPCDIPNNLGCGQTGQNFVNVPTTLTHGIRYIVCIHAESTILHHEKWDETLPELSTCSNGITVDMTPPTPGHVYIDGINKMYQHSVSDVLVTWESFVDVEELSNAPHSSGIAYYEIALGTHKGDSDVREFVRVSPTNHFVFHELNLQNGHKYYATVKGYDFNGRSTSSHSSPIVIDHTAPIVTNRTISFRGRHITSRDSVDICWSGIFSDAESGIISYSFAVGSEPGYDDIHPYTKTTQECATRGTDSQLKYQEGLTYFFSVMGFNGAGLTTKASSWAFIAEFSPPVVGYIFDGTKESGTDIDYQVDKHTLKAFWYGFHDPHTNIMEYYIEVGTEAGSDNVIGKQAIGVREDISLEDMHLIEGQRYIITLTACNAAELCSSVSTDGVVIDSSPPIPGIVKDGPNYDDVDFQSSRTHVVCKWYNFVDTQSGISHFAWRLGTQVGADDIVPATAAHFNDEIVIPDLVASFGKTLPINKVVYSTVRAYNKAGLWSESSSNGFLVDVDPPTFLSQLTLSPIGSLKESSLVLRDMLQVDWDVEDRESFIEKQYLSVTSHLGEDFNVSVQVPGLDRDYTFTNIHLHDGSLYDIHLWVCNGADLCAKSVIENVFVDSSKPTAGSFAIKTDRTADRKIQTNWMSWKNNSITLALVGFSDEHSGISTYNVNIGSDYMGNSLNRVPGTTVELEHNENSEYNWNDNGKVQIFNIPTNDISQYQHIFVSVWAKNGVGLPSNVIHSQFLLIPGGSMELVRRCSSYSCQGHCVCAAEDAKCPTDGNSACQDVIADSTYAKVDIKDMVYLRGEDPQILSHTPTKAMLAAKWEPMDTEKIQPKWYEWSVGLSDEDEPQGVFLSGQRIWHDAEHTDTVVFTIKTDLHENEKYSVFVRAWYSGITFATFKSPGVIIQNQKPQTTNLFGKSVKETLYSSGTDIDFTDLEQTLFINWTGAFRESSDLLKKYNVFLSHKEGGHGMEIMTGVPVTTTFLSLALSDLDLKPGVRYYSNVQVFTQSNLHTTAVSDGFVIDIDTPRSGVVFDGQNIQDLKYQNQSNEISAHWYGFTDIHSSVLSYIWCVSSSGNAGSCDIVAPINVGMRMSIRKELPSGIANGQTVTNEVVATDAAGHKSERAKSNGVTIDTTPPVPLRLSKTGNNLLQNPSFEDSQSGVVIAQFLDSDTCTRPNIPDWTTSPCVVILNGAMKDGVNALWLRGNVSQTITVIPGRSYSISFYVSYLPSCNNSVSSDDVRVRFDKQSHVYKIHKRSIIYCTNSEDLIDWQLVSVVMEATTEINQFVIETISGSNGLLIDDVEILEMIEISKQNGTSIGVHTVLLNDFTSVHASWKFEDPESGIKDYMWAIGTVRGGIQIQSFKSVGRRQSDWNSDIDIEHQARLYVTVVATNGAGLKTVEYSEPVLIDKTPPVILFVNDGPLSGEDKDFVGDNEIAFTFEAEDNESGIKKCLWALGTEDAYNFVFDYTLLPVNSNSEMVQIPEGVDTSTKFVFNVKCENNAGLSSEKRSDGVHLLLTSPDTTGVILDLLGSSKTQYPVSDSYHAETETLRVKWSGFRPSDKIKSYKVDMKGDDYHKTFEVLDFDSTETFLTLTDLQLQPGTYSCSLTGINELGVSSDVVTKNFTILQDVPGLKDDHKIQINWNRRTEVATADWQDVFNSSYPLYYEVSVGTERYGVDVVMWQETLSTNLEFTLHRSFVGEFGREVFVVVTAVSPSGTYSTTSVSQLIT